MPLLKSRFSVPKLPARKSASLSNLSQLEASVVSQEFGLDYGGIIKARLSGRDLVFKDGKWRVEGEQIDGSGDVGGDLSKEAIHLKRENKKINEENNLLKLKIDILLDMLAETTAEVNLQENEIDSLRGIIQRKPSSPFIRSTTAAT